MQDEEQKQEPVQGAEEAAGALAHAAWQELVALDAKLEQQADTLARLLAQKADELSAQQARLDEARGDRAEQERAIALLRDAKADVDARVKTVAAREAAFEARRKTLDEEYERLEEARRKSNDSAMDALKAQRETYEQLYKERLRTFSAWMDATQKALQEETQKAWREDIAAQLAQQKDVAQELVRQVQDAQNSMLASISAELQQAQRDLAATKRKTQALKDEQEDDRDELAEMKRAAKYRKEHLDAEAEQLSAGQIQALKIQLDQKQKALDELQQEYAKAVEAKRMFDALKLQFTDKPLVSMQGEIDQLREENRRLTAENIQLNGELGTRVSQDEYQAKVKAYQLLEQEKQAINEQYTSQSVDLIKLDTNAADLARSKNALENANLTIEQLQDELEETRRKLTRCSTREGQIAEREERVASIEHWTEDDGHLIVPEEGAASEGVSETTWLDAIGENCYDYGFQFPHRILYAYHTAMKIADWSTITVLAGVSGTGKSELPKLYARFGGFNFLLVPVQPNWDSQESMLGFFNSIDNKFEATKLMRFLARTSREEMRHSMNIVLLDEMNLAHVEYYFAEFLSRLEERRDCSDGKPPKIGVSIGAGMEPYALPLRRNLLWTGTMNQDETTKSLSDKVLDRGIVIHFPRPQILFSRREKQSLDAFLAGREPAPLDARTWSSWVWSESPFSPTQQAELDAYKTLLERINEALGRVGRALGHRVWQSVEHYAWNYPAVLAALEKANGDPTEAFRAALHIAVEDQIVQKVMPKLRGIDTRSRRGKECLARIGSLLGDDYGFALNEDFQLAQDLIPGQFMWNSALYIPADDIAGAPAHKGLEDERTREDGGTDETGETDGNV